MTMIAPIMAVTIWANIGLAMPKVTPSAESTKPPTNASSTPVIKCRINPPPPTRKLASQPAIRPMTRNTISSGALNGFLEMGATSTP